MSNLFNNELRTVLRVAHNLNEAGERQLAEDIYVSCVKDAAKLNNGKDVLTYFYGNKAYNELKSATDAARYIFIAKCARDAYAAIESLGSAQGSDKPWAVPSNDESDEELCEFFEWLSTKDRVIEDDDDRYFNILARVAKNRNKIRFKMADKLKKIKLVEIIPLVVGGIRGIFGGELR